jgi:hypothetical protein
VGDVGLTDRRRTSTDAYRTAVACFGVGILVSVVTRAWDAASLAAGEAIFHGGLLFGTALWLLGFYYGYRAVQSR